MSELEKLVQYISKGYQALTIRKTSKEEIESKLPEIYHNKEVWAVPIRNFETGETLMFYFIEEETKTYAEKIVKEGRTVIGYHPCFYCTVVSPEAIRGGFDLIHVIKSLKELKSWDVRKSEHPNTFEIHFIITGNDRDELKRLLLEVQNIALALSLKNEVGVSVNEYSEGPIFKVQPIAFTIGMEVKILDGLTAEELDMFEKDPSNNFIWVAEALQLIFSQVTDSTKIIIGWTTIEELFKSRPQHILSDCEQNQLKEKIRALSLDSQKEKKVLQQISSSDIMAIEGKNQRIARGIADALGESYDEVLIHVRSLAKDRGKFAHTTSEKPEIAHHIEFIKRVLTSFLKS